DNGIKFFAADGFKLPDRVEAEIERLIGSGELDAHRASGADIGNAYRVKDAAGRYCVYLKSTLPRDVSLSGLKIVVDCGHGAAYQVAPEVLHELGADVVAIGTEPSGVNINDGCGALHPDNVAKAVLSHGADIGIALDGDADRVILSDEKGNIVDGDAMLAILADHMAGRGTLSHDTIVATVMTNLGLERFLGERGITLERASVGDRYVVGRMRAGGFNLGGEQSGHIVLLNHTTTGDGMLTALQILTVMIQTQRRLSDLGGLLRRVPQLLRNLPVSEKPPIDSLPTVSAAIRDAEAALGTRGRVLVRYSGTEQKCRVMLEGDDDAEISNLADGIVAAVQEAIGVSDP
ncbi:MAG: phosphoglucosamine mutase, partial [Myxococcota bacterium]|nr:phosphoglucosamine mutase [Myxococcota bacterium]